MSYRELRNFKEILTVLGYPRLISIENFKTPHFELVADILIWLCQRYDKNMEILDTITTEHDRVAFLKSVAEQLLTKARVKLNLKNLYASNGFAVRELLKVATLLYDAHRNASGDAEEGEGDAAATADVGPGHKFTDVKATRRLASDITKYGIRLYELLGTHVEAKEAAARALGKNYDIDDMGRQLREMEGAVSEQTAQMEQMLGNVQQDEANLQSKIDKKKTELDRQQKRLQSLQTVRPAFMDEFERLEEEVKSLKAALAAKNKARPSPCLALHAAVALERRRRGRRVARARVARSEDDGDTLRGERGEVAVFILELLVQRFRRRLVT